MSGPTGSTSRSCAMESTSISTIDGCGHVLDSCRLAKRWHFRQQRSAANGPFSSPAKGQMIVFDQKSVIQAAAMVVAAATVDRIFLQQSPSWRCFPRVVQTCAGRRDIVDILATSESRSRTSGLRMFRIVRSLVSRSRTFPRAARSAGPEPVDRHHGSDTPARVQRRIRR